jgi:hypothetical protein
MDSDQDTNGIEKLNESYTSGPHRKQGFKVRESPDHLDAGLHMQAAEQESSNIEDYLSMV